MRTLQVMNAFQIGGVMQVVIDLSRQLRKAGHAVHVATVRQIAGQDAIAAGQRQRLKEGDVPSTVLGGPSFKRYLPLLPIRLLRLIDTFRPDIVHCHDEQSDFVVSAARRLRRFPVARTVHGIVIWPGQQLTGFVAEQGFRNELVVAVSEDALAAYREQRSRFLLCPSAHTSVIHNGVPLLADASVVGKPTNECRLGRARIGFFGRATSEKGLDILLKALSMLDKAGGVHADFFIHTTNHDSIDLKRIVVDLDIHVTLRPLFPDARKILADFDLIVMPSRHEGFGLLAIEACAASTPVLAARAPGLREVLPPDWPLFVPVEDPQALADSIRDYVRRRDMRPALAKKARDWAKNFSLETFTDKYVSAYERYLTAL